MKRLFVLMGISVFYFVHVEGAIVKISNNAPYDISVRIITSDRLRGMHIITTFGLSEIGRKKGFFEIKSKKSKVVNTGMGIRQGFIEFKPIGQQVTYSIRAPYSSTDINAKIDFNGPEDIRGNGKKLEVF